MLAVLLLVRLLTAKRPLVDLRDWWGSVREADLLGAGLLSIALGGIILAFATADPEVQVFSPAGLWYLVIAAVGAVLFALHNRRSEAPLVPHGAFAKRPAWGAIVVSFFVGAALIAALVDIPIFARITVADGSQIKAALVLVEFLVALPVGALLGGVLIRRQPAGVVAGVGMVLATVGFWLMSGWGHDSLHHLSSSVVLAMAGFGFGLALAPVNAALLASTADKVHGVASALLVVARMVGMLVGISALTTIGLRRYYAVESGIPSPNSVCGGDKTRCAAYTRLVEQAGIEQLQAIFLGAALCAIVAGVAAIFLLPRRPHARHSRRPGRAGHPVVCSRGPRLRRPARGEPSVRGDLRPLRVRRRRPRRHRHRHLHGLPDRARSTCSASGSATRRSSATPAAGSPPRRWRRSSSASTCCTSSASWSSRTPAARWRPPRSPSCASGSASRPAWTRPGSRSTWSRTSAAALRDDVAKVRSHPLIPDTTKVGGFLYDVDTGLLEQLI